MVEYALAYQTQKGSKEVPKDMRLPETKCKVMN
jgi:hypothetical protein